MSRWFTVSASSKIILCGEHAVVYGYPAIAIPISSLRAYADVTHAGIFQILAEDTDEVIELHDENPLAQVARSVIDKFASPAPNIQIRLRSQIPIASGLGSGAAVSTVVARAIVQALQLNISLAELNDIIFMSEQHYHGTPSGIDNTVIVYEKPIYFMKDQPIGFIDVQLSNEYLFLVADTGTAALTKESVGLVRQLYETMTADIQPILKQIGTITQSVKICLENNDAQQLGHLMTQNHHALQQLRISSPKLDKLVKAALSAGALGAKLSGGGQGGNMIVLTSEAKRHDVERALSQAGAVKIIATQINGD